MKKVSLVAATLAVLCFSQAFAQDAEKLAGAWSVAYFEEGGSKAPDKALLAMEVVIQGAKFSLKLEGKVAVEFAIKLDPAKNPKNIDFTYLTGKQKDQTELGIYKFEGDQVRICFNDVGKPRPKEFAVPEKSEVNLIVLKRKK